MMKNNDIEYVFAKIIVLSILVFILLFYGSRYNISYSTIILAEIALYTIYHARGIDKGQELLVSLITVTCAVLIAVLCLQLRMNLVRIILIFVGCFLGDMFILFCDRTNMQTVSYPLIVLGITFVQNINNEMIVKVSIAVAFVAAIILYYEYRKRQKKEEQVEEQKEE